MLIAHGRVCVLCLGVLFVFVCVCECVCGFFHLTKSYLYFDCCKVSLRLGVTVLALFFLIITINFYKHISKLFFVDDAL